MKKNYSIELSIVIVVLIVVSYWFGTNDGKSNTCDLIKDALLDNSRIRSVISNEYQSGYLKEIEKECKW